MLVGRTPPVRACSRFWFQCGWPISFFRMRSDGVWLPESEVFKTRFWNELQNEIGLLKRDWPCVLFRTNPKIPRVSDATRQCDLLGLKTNIPVISDEHLSAQPAAAL